MYRIHVVTIWKLICDLHAHQGCQYVPHRLPWYVMLVVENFLVRVLSSNLLSCRFLTMLHITALLIGIAFLTVHSNSLDCDSGPLSNLPYGGRFLRCSNAYLNQLFADTPEKCRRIAFYPDPDEPDFFPSACSSECGDILDQYYRDCVNDRLESSTRFRSLCTQNEDGIPCYSDFSFSCRTLNEINNCINNRFVFPGRCQNCSSLIESYKTSMGCCADTLMFTFLPQPYGFTTWCQSDVQPSVPTFCTLNTFISAPSATQSNAPTTEGNAPTTEGNAPTTEGNAPTTEGNAQENNSEQTMATVSIGLLAVVALLPLFIQ